MRVRGEADSRRMPGGAGGGSGVNECEEAEKILGLYKGDVIKSFDMVRAQMSSLAQRASLMLTLSGISMTIFCISGKYFAGRPGVPQWGMVAGELLILSSAFWIFFRVMRIKWISNYIDDDPVAMLSGSLRERNLRWRHYNQAGILFLTGATLYLGCIFYLFLFDSAAATPPLHSAP